MGRELLSFLPTSCMEHAFFYKSRGARDPFAPRRKGGDLRGIFTPGILSVSAVTGRLLGSGGVSGELLAAHRLLFATGKGGKASSPLGGELRRGGSVPARRVGRGVFGVPEGFARRAAVPAGVGLGRGGGALPELPVTPVRWSGVPSPPGNC